MLLVQNSVFWAKQFFTFLRWRMEELLFPRKSESLDSNLASSTATRLASISSLEKLTILFSWDLIPGTHPLMPHYLGELVALYVKQTLYLTNGFFSWQPCFST
jgi:hypothetical protein